LILWVPMVEVYNRRFARREVVIHPGEYFSSDEAVVISTILGSCISVALIDSTQNRGGLNHFLLPELTYNQDKSILLQKNARYGVHAMELLINQIMKMGSEKRNLTAKVFGGGSVLSARSNEKNVGYQNIQFIIEFLRNEKIPMIASDTGDFCGRKILFFPDTGRVLVKKLQSPKAILDIRKQESEIKKQLDIENDKIVLF